MAKDHGKKDVRSARGLGLISLIFSLAVIAVLIIIGLPDPPE